MNRSEWVEACAKRLGELIETDADYNLDLAETLANSAEADAQSDNPDDWTPPVDAADDEASCYGD